MSLLLFKGATVSAKAFLPAPLLLTLRRGKRRYWIGGLRRTAPVSRAFGLDRGKPIDRYYIERFLSDHAADIHGRVLEVGDDAYTRAFGGDRVVKSDVLHAKEGNPAATMVGDLANPDGLPRGEFDCIICTQTLMFIEDVQKAVQTLKGMLKPGGTALVTVAGISQICRFDMNEWGDYWRFTTLSARRLFERVFDQNNVDVHSYGNVLATVGFLHGLSADELREVELDAFDRDYQLVITIRAVKPDAA